MKIFKCTNCQHSLFFENTRCENCGCQVGYLHRTNEMYAYDASVGKWQVATTNNLSFKYCFNHDYNVCNWLMEEDDPSQLCKACDLNRMIPNLADHKNIKKWRNLEKAKHRLVYSLIRFQLRIENKLVDAEQGLAFDFLCNQLSDKPVMTGHASGLITINLDEADSVHREYIRKQLSEVYRTLIGHFRHEIGHYYWDQLVFPNPEKLQAFRALFGLETEDYAEALQAHYKKQKDNAWRQDHVSNYAAAHPWEDWAETWAHYFHLIDTLETAYSFGLSLHPNLPETDHMRTTIDFDPYEEADFDKIITTYLPITLAANSLNRGMGIPDFYPFVLNEAVIEKLLFVHQLIRGE